MTKPDKTKTETAKDLIEEAITNVRQDRARIDTILMPLIYEFSQSKEKKADHATLGFVAAKYLETLQRSNEQLVKLIPLLKKTEPEDFGGELGDDDHEAILDQIQEEKNK